MEMPGDPCPAVFSYPHFLRTPAGKTQSSDHTDVSRTLFQVLWLHTQFTPIHIDAFYGQAEGSSEVVLSSTYC